MSETAEIRKRHLFLTILCLLSYGGVFLQLIKNSYVILHDFSVGGKIEEAGITDSDNPALSGIIAFHKYAGWMGMIGIIAALLCFRGVRMMWKLQKGGFYIYSAGELMPLIAGMAFFGPTFYFTGYMASFMFALPFCFIAMYLSTIRHMS